MKPAFVSLVLPLMLLAPPNQGQQNLVIRGRVTSAATSAGLEGANLRIIEAGVSVGTVDSGAYRIYLPGKFRGQQLVLQARSIGFKPSSKSITLSSDTTTVDFVLEVDVNRLHEVVVSGATGATETKKLAFTVDKVDPSSAPPAASPVSPPPAAANPPINVRGSASIPAPATSPTVSPTPPQHIPGRYYAVDNTESYDRINDNPFLGARDNPLSTFSVDVDRASYSNIRRFVMLGQRPPKDAVRIEEMVNYFSYQLPEPEGGRHPFSVSAEVAHAPWHETNLLIRIGLQARRIPPSKFPPSNLVFLIDVSGSMMPPEKLPLVQDAMRLLVNQLREQDRVAIVVYAGAAGLVLPSTPGDQKETILGAIDRLTAGGSTAGGAGIKLAYEVSRQSFMHNGNNRVILATDGDFNVGASSDAEMERLIEDRRRLGIFLTVLGFGRGNLKDSKMEKLADKGNGNYAYIDNIVEAQKVLIDEMAGTLLTVAKDVKLQVEFNPIAVASYRLIGYENRMLRTEDFDDDAKDAGEIGAGHSVTALYEIVPKGLTTRHPSSEPLRYQSERFEPRQVNGAELAYIKLRYKLPDASTSRWLDHVVQPQFNSWGSTDFRFAASVAAFGMILRDSEHRGSATLDRAIELARESVGEDPGGYRADFVKLMQMVRAQSLLASKQ